MEENKQSTYRGDILRKARSKKRLGFKNLSASLNIPEKYLISLEEENYDDLPGPTYIRGYIRAYAKRLGIEPELILEGYNLYLLDEEKKRKKLKRTEEKEKNNFFPIPSYKVFWIGILPVLVAIYLLYKPEEIKVMDDQITDNEKVITRIQPELNISSKIKDYVECEERKDCLDIAYQSSDNKTKTLMNSSEDEGKILVSEEVNRNLDRININFSNDCWIEIMSKNQILEFQLAKAGTSINLEGYSPFKILIGNVNFAELFFNEKKIDITLNSNTETNVGCIVLPKGRCSEFSMSN